MMRNIMDAKQYKDLINDPQQRNRLIKKLDYLDRVAKHSFIKDALNELFNYIPRYVKTDDKFLTAFFIKNAMNNPYKETAVSIYECHYVPLALYDNVTLLKHDINILPHPSELTLMDYTDTEHKLLDNNYQYAIVYGLPENGFKIRTVSLQDFLTMTKYLKNLLKNY